MKVNPLDLNFAGLYSEFYKTQNMQSPTKGLITTGNKANRKKGKAQKLARKKNRK